MDCSNDVITSFTSDPDLTTEDGGTYKVYGISYTPGSIASYISGPFSALTDDIIDFNLCAQLSSNAVMVTVNGPLCDLTTEDADGDGVCDEFDQCPGSDDNLDSDGDGIPDCLDPCFGFSSGDFDGDGFCNDYDCRSSSESDFPNNNGDGVITMDEADSNGDNIPDDCTSCELWNIEVSDAGSCNNNGTVADAYDDFYLATVTVQFYNPPATGYLRVQQDAPSENFNFELITMDSVHVSMLDSEFQHVFTDVPLFVLESNCIVANFTDGNFCSTVTCPDFGIEECSCQEINIEVLSIECVDVDGTPYDTTDDEVTYTFIASKGSGGMGSSTEGQYGAVEDCSNGEEETSPEDCNTSTGDFGQVSTVTTGTNAANSGGTRRFSIIYDDGCQFDFDFPAFDGECCVPPLFSATIVCSNPDSGEEAGI